jgi:hypothetical protein
MSKTNGVSAERATFDDVFTKIADEIVNELPQFDSMSQDGIEWLTKVRSLSGSIVVSIAHSWP